MEQEYRKENSEIRYPFAAGAPMISDEGAVIPDYWLLDAIVHPVDLRGDVYVSAVEVEYKNAEITLSDSYDDSFVASGKWGGRDSSDRIAVLRDEYKRRVGTLVFGDTDLASGSYSFGRDQKLDAGACIPINRKSVRGLSTADGEVVSGHIRLKGGPGTIVRTYVDNNDRNAIRVDFVGTGDEECFESEPIRYFRIYDGEDAQPLVKVYNGGNSKNGVMEMVPVYSLEEICGPLDDGSAIRPLLFGSSSSSPAADDGSYPYGYTRDYNAIFGTGATYVYPKDGSIVISAPSAPNYSNPLRITSRTEQRSSPDAAELEDTGKASERDAKADSFFDPLRRTRGVITLDFRILGAKTTPRRL